MNSQFHVCCKENMFSMFPLESEAVHACDKILIVLVLFFEVTVVIPLYRQINIPFISSSHGGDAGNPIKIPIVFLLC